MVAGQPPRQPVLDQPGAAIGALEPVTAIAAQGERSIAAAVEEQQRLLAPFEPQFHLPDQPGGKPAPALGLFGTQVNNFDLGEAGTAKPARQLNLAVDPGLGQLHRFECGGGAGEDHRNTFKPGADHRDIAAVVAHSVVLLE